MVQQIHFLFHMTRLQTSRHACTRVSSCIHNVFAVMVFGLVKQRLNPWLHKAPSACVQRLLLAPDDGFGVGVHVEILSELSPRERVQLLNASDGGILEVVNVARSVFVQSSVGLTGTENDSVNLLWWRYRVAMLRIRNDPLKVRVPCEVFDGRAGKWMAEKGFGEEQD